MARRPQSNLTDHVTEPHISDFNPVHLGVMIVAGIFITTLAQPAVLGKLPLQNILKNTLHIARADMAGFFFAIGIAWYFKPFAGILTDAFPLFRTRRRSYLLVSSLLAGLSWIALGLLPHTYTNLLYASIIVNVFMVICSTVVGAYLVEAGQRMASTGRLSSLRQATMSLCQLINGPIAGFLASLPFAAPSLINAGMLIALFPIGWVFMRERPSAAPTGDPLAPAKHQLGIIFRSGNLWLAILFVGLYYFAPGFSTVLYYRQNDVLKMTQQQIGNLGIYAGGFGILSTIVYAFLIRRLPIRTILFAAVALAGLGTLFYLFYSSPSRAILIEAQAGFFGTLAEVVLLDLAARATPRGCEGLGYSLILSMRNLSLFGADKLGASLADKYNLQFSTMVWLNAGTTIFVLVLIPLLPRVLMMGRDQKGETGVGASAA
jgi:MFS family permease